MKSNYKRLGPYISEVNNRNSDLSIDRLQGISSIYKCFMQSKANIVDVEFLSYKVVNKYQFAFNPNTARMGDKIPIALNLDEPCIVSSIYPVFEITKTDEFMPEYLMMWFRRPEFDRYARFHSHGSAREVFGWEEMCNVELPIPSIVKQKEIVDEYHTIINRIKINEQLIQKLEETAQAFFKKWFVDYEFPDENQNPYKSSGGEMEFNKELGKDIPKGWECLTIGDVVDCNYSIISAKDNFKTIEYLDTSSITNNEIEEIQILDTEHDEIPSRAKRKVNHNDIIFSTVRPNLRHFGILKNPKKNMIVSTGFAVLKPNYKKICGELIYLLITSEENLQNLQARAEMSVSTYPSINPEDLLDINIIVPPKERNLFSDDLFKSQFELLDSKKRENKLLRDMGKILLSKLATIKN